MQCYIVSSHTDFASPELGARPAASNILKTQTLPFLSPFAKIDLNHKCYFNNGKDGQWSVEQHTWVVRPCERRNCFRHWRRYAWKKIRLLRTQMPARHYCYHIVLHCRKHLERQKQFTQLRKWQDKIAKRYHDAYMIAVKHRNKSGVHIHVLLATGAEVDADYVRSSWRKHFPAKKIQQFKPQYCTLKVHDNADRLIRYMFLGRRDKPRRIPPWYKIEGHAPVTVYK